MASCAEYVDCIGPITYVFLPWLTAFVLVGGEYCR